MMRSQPLKKPRLYIREVRMLNFKSYYGPVTITPSPTFSVLVGRNGTGKSNLFDAIMFVLGRNKKELRIEKFTDLINRTKDALEARVTITIDYIQRIGGEYDSSDESDSVELSDHAFQITRWVNKKSKNGFFINDMEATHEDVIKFLEERGIDPEIRHNIIPQQMITDFATLQPKGDGKTKFGFCEIFERALGLNHRDPHKLELERVVRQSEEQARLQIQKIGVIQKDLERLAPSLEIEIRLVNMTRRLSLLQFFESAEELIWAKNALKEEEKPLKELERQLAEIKELKQRENEVQNQEENEYRELVFQTQEKEEEIFKLQNKMKKYQEGLQKLENLLADNKQRLEEKEEDLDKQMNSYKMMKQEQSQQVQHIQLIDLNKQLGILDEELEKIRQYKTDCEVRIFNKVQPIDKRIEEITRELEQARNKTITLNRDLTYTTEQLDRTNQRKEAELGDFLHKQEKLKRITQEQKVIKEEIKRIQEKRKEGQNLLGPLVQQSQMMRENLTEIQTQLTHVRRELGDIQEAEKFDQGEDEVHQLLMKNQAIKSYAGRLDMMGTIDQKYKIAAMASAKRHLKSYVVEKTEDMMRIQDLLTKHPEIHEVDILCIETIVERNPRLKEKPYLPEIIDKEGNRVPYMLNLIDPNSKLAFTAFTFAVGTTLLGKTFNQGHSVAYDLEERHRVVTLEGALFETTGSFTKGNKDAYKYANTYLVKKKVKVDLRNKAKLERQYKSKEKLFHQNQTNLNNCQRQIYRLKEGIPPEGQEYRLEVRLKSMQREEENLRAYEQTVMGDKEQLLRTLDEEGQKLSDRSIAFKNELKEIKELVLPMERQLQQLKEERMEVLEETHQQIERKMKDLRERRMKLENEIMTTKYQMEKRDQIESGLLDEIKRKKKNLKKLSQQTQSMEEKIPKIKQTLIETVDQIKKTKKEIAEIGQKKEEIKDMVEQRRLKAAQNDDQEQEITHQILLEKRKLEQIGHEALKKKRQKEQRLQKFLDDEKKKQKVQKMKKKKNTFELLSRSDKEVYDIVTREYLCKGRGISRADLINMVKEVFNEFQQAQEDNKNQIVEEQVLQPDVKLHALINEIEQNPEAVNQLRRADFMEAMADKEMIQEMKEELMRLKRRIRIDSIRRKKAKSSKK